MPTDTLDQLHAEVEALERLLSDSQASLHPEVQIALRQLLDDVHRLMEALQADVRSYVERLEWRALELGGTVWCHHAQAGPLRQQPAWQPPHLPPA